MVWDFPGCSQFLRTWCFWENFALNAATGGIGSKGKWLAKAGTYVGKTAIEVAGGTAHDVAIMGQNLDTALLSNSIGAGAGTVLKGGTKVLGYGIGKGIKSLGWEEAVGKRLHKADNSFLESSAMGIARWMHIKACFAAGTPLLTPNGSKNIEDFRVGDVVLSRDEFNPEGPIEPKVVEEVFVQTGQMLYLEVGDKRIGTTPEHPFWVRGKGWLPASHLMVGDHLLSHDDHWVVLTNKVESVEFQTVYNLRVSQYHTYFVGGRGWDFSVWAHNRCAAALTDSMNRAGNWADPGSVAHHIVPRGAYRGNLNLAAAKRILARHGIDLDDAMNGVFLPSSRLKGNGVGFIHERIHTNDYFSELFRRLRSADSAGGKNVVVRELRLIAGELTAGTFNALPVGKRCK